MNRKLWRFAAGLLPLSFLSAQRPQPPAPLQTGQRALPHPSPEALRKSDEMRKRMKERAEVINDLAGNLQSLDDARRLVNLVAAEFSDSLPPQWATHGIRERIARAEYEAATEPQDLIPEQRVADAWDDFLEKIGAPRESQVTPAEIHSLRDSYFVSSQLFWARGNQTFWTVSNIYALGPDGKVANGCRALETLNILWMLVRYPDILQGARELIKKNQLFSDSFKNPSQPAAQGTQKGYVSLRVMPPNPIDIAARKYVDEHGLRAMNHAVEDLLNDLFGR